MKATHPPQAVGENQRDAMLQQWQELGRPPVDTHTLCAIQARLANQFGIDVVFSPASIARTLADEGAELRHPDVIECDTQWRQSRLEKEGKEFSHLEQLISGAPIRLAQAERFLEELQMLREKVEGNENKTRLAQLKSLVVQARQIALSAARQGGLDDSLRAEQTELSEWLKVWLQTPNLFADWLELRRRSEEFREKFRASAER